MSVIKFQMLILWEQRHLRLLRYLYYKEVGMYYIGVDLGILTIIKKSPGPEGCRRTSW